MTPTSARHAAYLTHLSEARELLAMLTKHVDDCLDIDPDAVKWDAVGSAAALVASLREIEAAHVR